MIAMALLGLTATPNIAYGQEKGDKAKPAKTDKDKAAKDDKAGKDAKKGDEKGSPAGGDDASRLERLQQAMAERLKLSPEQKTKIDQLFANQKKAAEAAAKARAEFQAQYGDKLEQLSKQLEEAKKAGDEAKIKTLTDERNRLQELRAQAAEQHAGSKPAELFAAIGKVLQPEQATQFRAILVELKLAAGEDAGSTLDIKDVMKAVMGRAVGLEGKEKEEVSKLFKQKAAEIKTAKGDKAKIAQIRTALRSELAAKLGPERWQTALNEMAEMEKKAGKQAKSAPSSAPSDAGKGKSDANKKAGDDKKKEKKDKG
ncbi:MAG: hypothetical protein C4547_13040 [Phycisphaerales bacterium]|nr:MAG: hypothetical protein C4547_13040 [Phycisphaerales bacterium]